MEPLYQLDRVEKGSQRMQPFRTRKDRDWIYGLKSHWNGPKRPSSREI